MGFWKMNLLAALIGLGLDLLVGDPEGWPHPVIWFGRFIAWREARLRSRGGNLRVAALALTTETVLLAMLITVALLILAAQAGWIVLLIVMSVLSWNCLSARCLAREGRGVAQALEQSTTAGRARVARIVGRDTAGLNWAEILRATVETIAENTTDGVISPLIYLALGGPVLAIGFKAASTLDSMVGYMDEKYLDIGWSSARLDDILNYLPARLTALLLILSAYLSGQDGAAAFRIVLRDHDKHLSPNCAWSEAAVAGALHLKLGGAHSYFGKTVEKPSIGDDLRPIEVADIARASRMMYIAAAIMAVLFAAGVMLL